MSDAGFFGQEAKPPSLDFEEGKLRLPNPWVGACQLSCASRTLRLALANSASSSDSPPSMADPASDALGTAARGRAVGRRIFLEPTRRAPASIGLLYTLSPKPPAWQSAWPVGWLWGWDRLVLNPPPLSQLLWLWEVFLLACGPSRGSEARVHAARPRRSVARLLLGVLVVLAAPQSRQQKVDLPAHRLPVQIRPGCDPRIPAQPLIIAPLRLCRWRRFHTHQ